MLTAILIVCVFLHYGGSQPQERARRVTPLNNSTLSSLIGVDQCVTREEVQAEVQAIVEDVITAKAQDIISDIRDQVQSIRNEVQALAGIRTEVQSLTRHVAEIQNHTATLRDKIQSRSCTCKNLTNDKQPDIPTESTTTPEISSNIGRTAQNPATSCNNLPQGSSSGNYWIQTNTGSPTSQYCDMTRTSCCSTTGGWMRVANLDMTDPNQQCPSGFRLVESPRRTCSKPVRGCVSTTFPVHGVEYSRVCGKVIAYQFGHINSFSSGLDNIDSHYAEGVSLTHGSPRQHIWTFVAAYDENRVDSSRCPCSRTDRQYIGTIPSFVGQDYFCDSGTPTYSGVVFYSEDPLWDGQGCGPNSSCCSFNNPPWFCKTLPQSTRDDIELRLCANGNPSGEDTPIESVEIYVQ